MCVFCPVRFSGTANVGLESMYCIVLQSPGHGIGNGKDGYTAVQPMFMQFTGCHSQCVFIGQNGQFA